MAALSGKKFFWGPVRYGQEGFQVECVSGHWDRKVKNGDGLSGMLWRFT